MFTRKSRISNVLNVKATIPEPPPQELVTPPVSDLPPQTKLRAAKAKQAIAVQENPPARFSPEPLPKHSVRQPRRQQDENVHNHHYPNQQDVRPAKVSKVWTFEQSMEEAGLNPVSSPPASPVRRNRSKEGIAKVVIPLSDTPIIQRNKQFRKDAGGAGGSNSRRSSLGLRGRRASSLIDNGQVGTL